MGESGLGPLSWGFDFSQPARNLPDVGARVFAFRWVSPPRQKTELTIYPFTH